MNKLDVRLIALDLDDTLLNENREISDENVRVLRACTEKGIYVVLCSGRAEDAILPFIRRLEIAGKEAGRYLIAIMVVAFLIYIVVLKFFVKKLNLKFCNEQTKLL